MPRSTIGTLPNIDFSPYPIWWNEASPQDGERPALPQRCDVAIVGGGFSGLSTALELARNGVQVAVFEADAFGANASARNSGGVSFGLDLAAVGRWRKWAGGKGPAVPEFARGALDSLIHMQAFVADNAVDCDFHLHGRLSCAPTPKHYELLARKVEGTNRLFDAGAYMVNRADQHAEIGSDVFHGAMVIPRSAQLQPARLLHALVALCREAGVLLYGRTPVRSVERSAQGGFEVGLASACVHADTVVVATNAHAARVGDTGLHRRIVPVASHIIVTDELPSGVADALIPKMRTGADSRRLLAYFRRTPDGRRFLYGGRAAPVEVAPEAAARALYRRMVASFPQLDGVRIAHAWGCKVAFTLDHLPHIGQLNGVHYVAGCNGNGVAMMNYLGHQLARKILDGGRSGCVFDQVRFPSLPLYDGRPWFLPIVATAYGALDRIDEMSLRRA
jgi:glycine/D-amino acid oxidase-like deaminating enzyme